MKEYLSLVKFSHTIFALPFAMVGMFLALEKYHQSIPVYIVIHVLLCMVFARNAAMAFNRYLDRDIDQANPRTAVREIPAGKVSPRSALLFVIGNSLLFILTTWFINPLCFYLSPVALFVILGYSYTKRFTFLCHFVLGLGLALAPIGAYLAAGGGFELIPVLLGFVVLLWVSGFDIMYALQDEDFDKEHQLSSIPVQLGTVNALRLSNTLHIICALAMGTSVYLLHQEYANMGILSIIGGGLFIGLLGYQHTLVKPDDLSKINLAFFTTNGIASVVFGVLIILDLFV